MDDIRRFYAAANHIAEIQFAWDDPDLAALFDELEVTPGLGYFLLRAAPMGTAAPEVVAAAIAFFPPVMVAKLVGRARLKHPPYEVLELARPRLVALADRRFGADETVAAAADLCEAAVAATDTSGRALAAAWKSVRWDESDGARLFVAATVLREHRGDGHIHALAAHGLTPLQGRLLAAARRGGPVDGSASRFGWRPDDIGPARADLEERGVVAGDALGLNGAALWDRVEALTDDLSAGPPLALGDRLREAIVVLEGVAARVGAITVGQGN